MAYFSRTGREGPESGVYHAPISANNADIAPTWGTINCWGFHMSCFKPLTLTLLVAVIAAGCISSLNTALPTKGHVFKLHDSYLEPATNVLVLVNRINVCDSGFMSEASTTGIDAHLVRTDSNGAFEVPPKTYSNVCSRVILLSNGIVPGYKSQSGRVRLHYKPEEKNRGITENDAILIPSQVTEARGKELAGDLYSMFSSYTVTSSMAEQIYMEMLPEIEQLAQKTEQWNEECYRIGGTSRLVDQEINRATCKYYEYRSAATADIVPTADPGSDCVAAKIYADRSDRNHKYDKLYCSANKDSGTYDRCLQNASGEQAVAFFTDRCNAPEEGAYVSFNGQTHQVWRQPGMPHPYVRYAGTYKGNGIVVRITPTKIIQRYVDESDPLDVRVRYAVDVFIQHEYKTAKIAAVYDDQR